MCSLLIRLAAHLFVPFQTMPWTRFAFGHWRVDIAYSRKEIESLTAKVLILLRRTSRSLIIVNG